ncbi:hypothetical protein [Actinoplanes awajinensis]|uniref:Uncharacterized protein n=1 Tax=Actinoplanes awajinensis subsp. mycoplanecinus TaxID=135947 RepID=A0A101JQZ9_9ACTN|nr:hypothetical protein [Actinoplanes awajinensis]KUL31442.1 hypothetical protein ADL15_22165 [Actinoplanes awajinensis subsp. mycoplanecinus]
MGGLQTGGGTSAVAASAHAGCERFRLTDPFITRESRRALAARLGEPDTGAGIPQARWIRAMTFEKLVRDDRFAAELVTTTVGQLGLSRPTAVRRRACRADVSTTATELASAHRQAIVAGEATMLVGLAVPYLELEHVPDASSILPDFAVVCPRRTGNRVEGSWLIMGDAKDYERVRSRIDDGRMLKGFLQVALGAESAAAWTRLPDGMHVHGHGVLAVPRNAFLRPQAVVERLDDHRTEVRVRAQERLAARSSLGDGASAQEDLAAYVAHLEATFDPRSCATCNLFSYCRTELRSSDDPKSLLIEIGVAPAQRNAVQPLVTGTGETGRAPHTTVAQVTATVTGMPQWHRRPRVDPCGRPGTVNLVLVKSDGSALGVHGVAVQRVGVAGPEEWNRLSFADPQAADTRRAVMSLLGRTIREQHENSVGPVHLVVPDRATADLLASAADSLAGVELSRLRWQRDQDRGRPLRTFDDEEATLPGPLTADERLAVSFLLEEDRARTMRLRTPIVDLHGVLLAHVVPGGPAVDAGRLDYLITWAEAIAPLDHRKVSDTIAEQSETPGVRLSNRASDDLFHALRRKPATEYHLLVTAALDYRISVLERALTILDGLAVSRLREVHQALESDAQQVWRRRQMLQASDLVRFSRMYPHWRNSQVDLLDTDRSCGDQLTCLTDLSFALDKARDAGVRQLALAAVVGLNPIRLEVQSRRLGHGVNVVALHINDRSLVEDTDTTVTVQKGSFKLGRLPLGFLTQIPDTDGLVWAPAIAPELAVGDELVLADAGWFGKLFKSGHEIAVARPALDKQSAPTIDCTPASYPADPEAHRWCCKPHAVAEAEWSDELAARRERGELNPAVWPPLVDDEHFDVTPGPGMPEPETATAPAHLTPDDLD